MRAFGPQDFPVSRLPSRCHQYQAGGASSYKGFVAAAWDVVGRKVSKARLLSDIYETACTSAALPVPLDSPAIAMFRLVLAEARSLVQQRNVIEAHAHELCSGVR